MADACGPPTIADLALQVGLRRLDRFMTEPQRDHGAVDAACSSSIAALCLSTCGETRFDFNASLLNMTAEIFRSK